MADLPSDLIPVANLNKDVPRDLVPLGPSRDSGSAAPRRGLPPPIIPSPEDVIPPVANFALSMPRALAADLYATVDLAKRQLRGEPASRERWWENIGKSMKATEIPETETGQKISRVLDIPGRLIGGAVELGSNLLLGKERTQEIAPYAKVAADAALPVVGAKLLGREGSAVEPAVTSPLDVKAAGVVAKRLAEGEKYGGPSATEAIEQIAKGRQAGKPLTIADVGGEPVRALGGYVARQPGEGRAAARSFLETRDKGASARLAGDVQKYVFGGPTMVQTTDRLLQERSRSARPLYEQAEALQGVWSPRLQEFISEPDVRKGLARGYRLERLDSLAEGRKFDPTQLGVDLDFEGNIVMKKVPNLRVLDMGKRGLDAMIADERDPITGRLSATGVSLDKVRQAYVNEIDALDTSGTYRAARDAWGGPSRSMDAMRWGRSIFRRSPEETAKDFARLSPNDQEFARLGVADLLRQRIAETGFSGNEARALIKNPWTRDQLQPIFRSAEDFEKFSDAVMAEHQMAQTTSKLTGGSQTAERVAEDKAGLAADLAPSTAYMAHHVIHGNFPAALVHAWRVGRRMYEEHKMAQDPALNEAVASIIFNPDIELLDPRVRQMVTGESLPTAPSRARTIARQAGTAGGGAAAMGLTHQSYEP